jgi:hypothetical protein
MDVLISIILLVGLLVWIIFDMIWLRRKPAVISKETGWSSSAFDLKQARHLLFGIAGAIFLFALNEWFHPSLPPFTGRLSSIETALYYSFGPKSLAVFWAMFASFLLLMGLLRKKGNTK